MQLRGYPRYPCSDPRPCHHRPAKLRLDARRRRVGQGLDQLDLLKGATCGRLVLCIMNPFFIDHSLARPAAWPLVVECCERADTGCGCGETGRHTWREHTRPTHRPQQEKNREQRAGTGSAREAPDLCVGPDQGCARAEPLGRRVEALHLGVCDAL